MVTTWVEIIFIAVAWISGWLYGSSGAWNEGYEAGKNVMQLQLQGSPMVAEQASKLYDWDEAIKKRSESVPHKAPQYDMADLTPRPFQSRLSMIQGGKK